MTIAELPPYYDMVWTNLENGRMTTEAQMWQDQTFQTLDEVVNEFNTGLIMTNFTTAQITALLPNAAIGTVYFNTTLAKLQVVVAANTLETVTSV